MWFITLHLEKWFVFWNIIIFGGGVSVCCVVLWYIVLLLNILIALFILHYTLLCYCVPLFSVVKDFVLLCFCGRVPCHCASCHVVLNIRVFQGVAKLKCTLLYNSVQVVQLTMPCQSWLYSALLQFVIVSSVLFFDILSVSFCYSPICFCPFLMGYHYVVLQQRGLFKNI